MRVRRDASSRARHLCIIQTKGVDTGTIRGRPAGIFCLFFGFLLSLLLTPADIYSIKEEVDMTFFVLLLLACFVGFLGAEVLQ